MLDGWIERAGSDRRCGAEQALQENKAKLDYHVDTEKTADAINDFLIKTVTSAMQPETER